MKKRVSRNPIIAPWLLLAGMAAASPAPAQSVTAPPGGVIRWPGHDISSCQMEDRVWAPVAGECWVPVDLLATGELTASRTSEAGRETLVIRVGPYPYPEQRLTVPGHMVHLSPEDQERSRRESRKVAALWQHHTRPRFTLPLGSPLDTMAAGRAFGARRVFNNEPRSPHTGVDYRAAKGTRVLAAEQGTVLLAEEHFFAGKSVYIDHGGGLITMYFHLDTIAVAEGADVKRGQVIGTVGSTGRSTGPHLHFGVRWLGARVDPAILLNPDSATRAPGL